MADRIPDPVCIFSGNLREEPLYGPFGGGCRTRMEETGIRKGALP